MVVPPHETAPMPETTGGPLPQTCGSARNADFWKHQYDHQQAEEKKQRSIPPLEERLAKGGQGDAYRIHAVQPGETLSEIMMAYYGTCKGDALSRVKKTNEIEEMDTVQAGWQLILPVIMVDGVLRPDPAVDDISDIPASVAAAEVSSHAPDGNPEDAGSAPREMPMDEIPTLTSPSISLFQEGVTAFKNEDYGAAYDAFTAVYDYESRCDTCEEYLAETEARAKLHLENGLGFFRKRNYAHAIRELKKARVPATESQAQEYLFKSYFEIALKRFLQYKRSGSKNLLLRAENSLKQAQTYRSDCPGCLEYEEVFKKTHYNNGIKYFTGNDGESMDKAVKEWEKVRFVDPEYKDVEQNIIQAEDLLKKLKKFKKVS